MFTVDSYLVRRFDMKRYNCWHLAQEVWTDLTGEKLVSRDIGNFVELRKPRSPCIVLMQKKNTIPHVGIYYEGKVLHLHPIRGACYEPSFMAALGFQSTAYYVSRAYADRMDRQEPA